LTFVGDALSLGEHVPKFTLLYGSLYSENEHNIIEGNEGNLSSKDAVSHFRSPEYFNSKTQIIFNTKLRPNITQIFLYLLPAVYSEADNSFEGTKADHRQAVYSVLIKFDIQWAVHRDIFL